MQVVQSNVDIAIAPRQYRNRPNPRTIDRAAEPLRDAVYLIGDDPFLREQISDCFGAAATRVIGFSSAQEYLDFVGNDAASCVIIDDNLPDMCGLELQCRLAATSKPPVVFISDRCDIRLTVCAMKAGAIDFLTKPFDVTALVTAIRTGLSQDRRSRVRRAELATLQSRFQLLTPREREVLPLVVGGLLNKQAAGVLGISEVTLQIHRSQVMRKLQADSLAELVRMALKLRIPYWREESTMSGSTQ
jgi:FixJ family two-component response regulator